MSSSYSYSKRKDFVKANFCFILNSASSCQNRRGNDSFEWDDVTSVVVKTEGQQCCPICLGELKLPSITRCGHMYCKICAMTMFIHSGDTWVRCPLCFELCCETEMKTVAAIHYYKTISVKGRFNFLLLKRKSSSIVPVPSASGLYCNATLPSASSMETFPFSRKFLNDGLWSMKIRDDQLGVIESVYCNELEVFDYLEMELVQKLREELLCSWPPLTSCSDCDHNSETLKNTLDNEKDIYFYQIDDSRLLFLDPFNIKCLIHEYGQDRSKFPAILSNVEILDVQYVTLTPECLKRNTFLLHLPCYACVGFVDVDLRQYLSSETKQAFKEDFRKRSQKRASKRRIEKKHEIRAKNRQAWENELMDPNSIIYSNDFYNNDSIDQFMMHGNIEEYMASSFDARLGTGESTSAPVSNLWANNTIASFSNIASSDGHFPGLPPATTVAPRDTVKVPDAESPITELHDRITKPKATGKKGKPKKIRLLGTANF